MCKVSAAIYYVFSGHRRGGSGSRMIPSSEGRCPPLPKSKGLVFPISHSLLKYGVMCAKILLGTVEPGGGEWWGAQLVLLECKNVLGALERRLCDFKHGINRDATSDDSVIPQQPFVQRLREGTIQIHV